MAVSPTMSIPLSVLSLLDAVIILREWVSHETFYTVVSFNEAPEDTGFHYFSLFLLLFAIPGICFSPFLLHSVASAIRGELSE